MMPAGDAPAPEPVRPATAAVPQKAESPAETPVSLTGERKGKASSHTDEAEHQEPVRKLVIKKLSKYNKFLTTPSEKLELERLAVRMSGALGGGRQIEPGDSGLSHSTSSFGVGDHTGG